MTTTSNGHGVPPKARVAVDVVLLTISGAALNVLLVQREKEPFEGAWALPGVFMRPDIDRDLPSAALRALREKAGIAGGIRVKQRFAWHNDVFDASWTLSVVYYAFADYTRIVSAINGNSLPGALAHVGRVPDETTGGLLVQPRLGTPDAEVVELAFAHSWLLGATIDDLQNEVISSNLALDALPETFTLRQLQTVYEGILGRQLNKDSFRRSIIQSRGIVEPTEKWQTDVGHRPAQLYRRARDI